MAVKKKTTKRRTGGAPKGNTYAKANCKYKEEYDLIAFQFCLLGADDAQLAETLRVTETTINNWKIRFPKFFESMLNGKARADAKVAEAMYQRALGYSHPEEKIFSNQGEIVRADTIKHYPPDTAAASVWLRNRRSDKWKDKQEIVLKKESVDDMSEEDLIKHMADLSAEVAKRGND